MYIAESSTEREREGTMYIYIAESSTERERVGEGAGVPCI